MVSLQQSVRRLSRCDGPKGQYEKTCHPSVTTMSAPFAGDPRKRMAALTTVRVAARIHQGCPVNSERGQCSTCGRAVRSETPGLAGHPTHNGAAMLVKHGTVMNEDFLRFCG